ncbi:MAG: hypothetical protein ACREO3_01700, partial [Arenimonas sp.]
MKTHEKFLAVVIAVVALAAIASPHWLPTIAASTPRERIAPPKPVFDELPPVALRPPPQPPFDPAAFAIHLDTAHYAIASNATTEQTAIVAEGVEALHAAYAQFFAGQLAAQPPGARLQVALYRDRADFRAHNATRAWAHGYYRTPVCHAYYDANAPSPTQWVLHEATHQLDTQWADFARTPWVEESLASYFGTSRIEGGVLRPGNLDPKTYPLRWMSRLRLGGDRESDLAAHRIVSLRELIDSDGPQLPSDVNRYYLGYFSLGHYLLHGEGGRHADAFRTMVAQGGKLEDFERLVGPVDRVEA